MGVAWFGQTGYNPQQSITELFFYKEGCFTKSLETAGHKIVMKNFPLSSEEGKQEQAITAQPKEAPVSSE